MANHLFYGDNLGVLRDHLMAESVDLIYLDPPFNSHATYNVLFKSPAGAQSQAQIEAFLDTWQWSGASEQAFDEVMQSGNSDVSEMLRAFRSFMKESDMMAYLTMMAVRLIELHRILKPSGSLYLHCDPTASHYLKILLDGIFGAEGFRDDIVWKRAETVKGNFGQGSKFFDRNTDSILFYAKSNAQKFNPQFKPYTQQYIQDFYKFKEPDGRIYRLISMTGPGGASKGNPEYEVMGVRRHWRYSRDKMNDLVSAGMVVQTSPGSVPQRKLYLDQGKGVPVQSLWDDIPALHSQSGERLGYPTQKPLALLERIVESSSNPGDVVLDPFCGCGTAVHAAQKLGRRWVGIDITHLAISLIEKRLNDAFPGLSFEVHGTPKDLDGARRLAEQDKYQFQWWAVSLVNAIPYGGRKKGADSGIDGFIYFKPEGKATEKAIVSVKGGNNVDVAMIRDLGHVIERENAKIGVLISLAEATKPMQTEALKAGFFETPFGKYPKNQILTVAELFAGKKPDIPPVDPSVFRKAQEELNAKQSELF